MKVNSMAGFYSRELLEKTGRVLCGDELGEGPEIEEAKAEKHTGEFRIEMDDLVFGRDPVARQDQDFHYMLQKAGMEGE